MCAACMWFLLSGWAFMYNVFFWHACAEIYNVLKLHVCFDILTFENVSILYPIHDRSQVGQYNTTLW